MFTTLFQEGPHSTLPEDEFFDAFETGMDKVEEDTQIRFRLKLQSQQSQISTTSSVPNSTENTATEDEFGTGGAARVHRLWPEVIFSIPPTRFNNSRLIVGLLTPQKWL